MKRTRAITNVADLTTAPFRDSLALLTEAVMCMCSDSSGSGGESDMGEEQSGRERAGVRGNGANSSLAVGATGQQRKVLDSQVNES